MNSHEINLYESKVKQLEGTIKHLQKKLLRCAGEDDANDKSLASPGDLTPKRAGRYEN